LALRELKAALLMTWSSAMVGYGALCVTRILRWGWEACRISGSSITQRSQPSLQSFFTKSSKELVPPTVPTLRHVVAHVIEPTSSVANVSVPSPKSSTHLDTGEMEELSIFPQALPTDMVHADSWEFIVEPHLNRFLGFGRSVESVAESLKGQKKALVSMVKFLREFTRRFRIDGRLLEGKVRQLIKSIEILCVSFSMCRCCVTTCYSPRSDLLVGNCRAPHLSL